MPTIQQIQDCAEFLGQLTQWGAHQDNLRTVEDAYWALLVSTAPMPYEDVSPFGFNGAPDIERIARILPELGASPLCRQAEDIFWEILGWAGSQADRDDDLRIKARGMSIAALWQVAVVMVLAVNAGVYYDTRKRELRALVLEAAPQ